jgi:predicted transcriptional regulator
VNTFIDQRVLDRLRAEHLEMPGMKLRIEQVQRLCGIEQTMCKLVLDALVKTGFLCQKSDGTYVRLTEGGGSHPRLAKAAMKLTPFVTMSRRAS